MRQLIISKSITGKDSQSLQYYFNEVSKIPTLTNEEEYELSVLAFNGDEKARERLVKANLRFVISVAKQYRIKGVKLDDLINEGNLGLMKAATRFDPSRGFKFISYAVWLIRSYILNYITTNGDLIRKPGNKASRLFGMKRDISLLEQNLQREASYDEIYKALDKKYTDDEIEFYFNSYNHYVASLDAPLMSGEDFSLGDTIKDSNFEKPTQYVDTNDSNFRCEQILNLVTDDEREILTLQYGLDGSEKLTTKEVSEILGMSPSRVAIVRDSALRKLNYKIRNKASWLKE